MPGTHSLYSSAFASAVNLLPRLSQQLPDRAIAEQLQNRICRIVILADAHHYAVILIWKSLIGYTKELTCVDWSSLHNASRLISVA
jgi:hypothetical protein